MTGASAAAAQCSMWLVLPHVGGESQVAPCHPASCLACQLSFVRWGQRRRPAEDVHGAEGAMEVACALCRDPENTWASALVRDQRPHALDQSGIHMHGMHVVAGVQHGAGGREGGGGGLQSCLRG